MTPAKGREPEEGSVRCTPFGWERVCAQRIVKFGDKIFLNFADRLQFAQMFPQVF